MENRNIDESQSAMQRSMEVLNNEAGRIGYIIAWLLGVPVSLLFVIFLIRGH